MSGLQSMSCPPTRRVAKSRQPSSARAARRLEASAGATSCGRGRHSRGPPWRNAPSRSDGRPSAAFRSRGARVASSRTSTATGSPGARPAIPAAYNPPALTMIVRPDRLRGNSPCRWHSAAIRGAGPSARDGAASRARDARDARGRSRLGGRVATCGSPVLRTTLAFPPVCDRRSADALAADCDAVLALGGDGTMLACHAPGRSARGRWCSVSTSGSLGYLAEIDVADLHAGARRALQGATSRSSRARR